LKIRRLLLKGQQTILKHISLTVEQNHHYYGVNILKEHSMSQLII